MLRALLAGSIGVGTGAGAYGYLYERHRVSLTRATLSVSGLPPALTGLRIGLLTDPHVSRTVEPTITRAAVELLQSERPDLIVLGGDYVSWRDAGAAVLAAELLAPLAAPHGVFAILGNHDDGRHVPAALRARGIEVLRDARTSRRIRGETLDLVGLDFWTRTPARIASLLSGAGESAVLLAHDPRRLEEAAAFNVPLLLSGHTHGGQIVLPGLGAVAARKFPAAAGLMFQGNTVGFVSRGVGTVYLPLRLNCPPEVAVLTLDRRADF